MPILNISAGFPLPLYEYLKEKKRGVVVHTLNLLLFYSVWAAYQKP